MRQLSADDLSVCLALTRGPFHKRLKTHLFSKSYPPYQSSPLLPVHLELNSELPWTPIQDQRIYKSTNPIMPGRWRRG
jgi:hypothetical protein